MTPHRSSQESRAALHGHASELGVARALTATFVTVGGKRADLPVGSSGFILGEG